MTPQPASRRITPIGRCHRCERRLSGATYYRAVIRIVLADDSFIVREGIGEILGAQDEFEVVASVEDSDSLLGAIEAERPDVVVTDIRMPPTHTDEGLRVAAGLRATHPDCGVVVLSQYAEPAYALALLADGSDGRAYLLKERVHDRLHITSAIKAVADGGSVIDPKVVEGLVEAKATAEHSRLSELTPREREVLAKIAEGMSNIAVAEALVLSKRAVEKHINAIFLKLDLAHADDVSKRVKATLLFLAESG
jgi:DNA-binding NarL/FixJ family response regulator